MSKQDLLLLFDRPQEPVFAPKGDRQAVFEVSQDFLVCYKNCLKKTTFTQHFL